LEGLDQLQTANFRYNNIKCPCNESSKYHASHTYIKAWLRNHTDAEAVSQDCSVTNERFGDCVGLNATIKTPQLLQVRAVIGAVELELKL